LNQYPYGDPYWPTLAPQWLCSGFDTELLLRQHKKALDSSGQ